MGYNRVFCASGSPSCDMRAELRLKLVRNIVSLSNKYGVRVDIQVQADIGQKINEFVAQLLQVCPTPHRAKMTFVRNTVLTALADNKTLQFMNDGLVKKSKECRQKKAKKYFGVA